MKLTTDRFPILECIKNNILSNQIQEFLNRQIHDKDEQREVSSSFPFFVDKKLKINYISKSIHQKLLHTSNFIEDKGLLKGSPTTTGLLLLPETVYSDFTNVPDYVKVDSKDYPINVILYSWLTMNEHDRIWNHHKVIDLKRRIKAGETPPLGANWRSLIENIKNEDEWENGNDRELLILPIYSDGTTQATKQSELINNDELYGLEYNEQQSRGWYGKIHDYVMSFILFYNYTESETKIIDGIDSSKQRGHTTNGEKYINLSQNEIEIII